jgi:carbonic anhydrase
MGASRSTRSHRIARGLVFAVLCLFPAVALGEPPHPQDSGQTFVEHDPYLVCEQGKRQSPINIVTSEHEGQRHDLVFRYPPTSGHIVHDGHSFQARSESTRIVLLDGHSYQFLQGHFHDPSEHHIDGVSYAMELHLVHKDSEGKLLVIGVLAQEGEEQKELARLGAWVEKQVGHRMVQSGEEVTRSDQFDLMKVLPKDLKHFYAYGGSLTTPPCTEGVQWVVLKEPIELSKAQISRFMQAYGPIARPVQPLRDREIEAQ